jgi:hypothetical protein
MRSIGALFIGTTPITPGALCQATLGKGSGSIQIEPLPGKGFPDAAVIEEASCDFEHLADNG